MKFFMYMVVFLLSAGLIVPVAVAQSDVPLPEINLQNLDYKVAQSSKKTRKIKKQKKKSSRETGLPSLTWPKIWDYVTGQNSSSKKKSTGKAKQALGNKRPSITPKAWLQLSKGQVVKIPLPTRKIVSKTLVRTQSSGFKTTVKNSKKSFKRQKEKANELAGETAIKAAMPLPPPLTKWSREEIIYARAQCQKFLKGVDVTVTPIEPMRFNRCGSPAPLKVSAVSEVSGDTVTITPNATMNCEMTSRFAKWVKEHLQPLARKHFSSPVKMVHNVASYSCRNRYNDKNKKLSEHALANALDIAGFTLANGEIVSVLKHWPEEEGEEKSQFLKDVHKSACKSFVVVLGPEANEAHKNHFHFDLGRYPVCE